MSDSQSPDSSPVPPSQPSAQDYQDNYHCEGFTGTSEYYRFHENAAGFGEENCPSPENSGKALSHISIPSSTDGSDNDPDRTVEPEVGVDSQHDAQQSDFDLSLHTPTESEFGAFGVVKNIELCATEDFTLSTPVKETTGPSTSTPRKDQPGSSKRCLPPTFSMTKKLKPDEDDDKSGEPDTHPITLHAESTAVPLDNNKGTQTFITGDFQMIVHSSNIYTGDLVSG